MRIGFGLSSEEYTPDELMAQVKLAQQAGFAALWVSDHYHPWNDAQGQSPFVWSTIGAISQISDLPVMTGVTCPTVRTHPAVIAQAAATSAVFTRNKFILGVGSGEALNEHILGDAWPAAGRRLDMLAEAIELMRELWTGKDVTHYGEYYTVENARIYTLPDEPIQVYVSGFGKRSTELAARLGDGYVNVAPSAEAVQRFREASGGKPAVAGAKACWAASEDEARKIAHERWANEGLPGELAQVLPTPKHFEQANQLVTPDMIKMACGPDPKAHLEMMRTYAEAGYDTVYVAPVGPHFREMIDLYHDEIMPQFS